MYSSNCQTTSKVTMEVTANAAFMADFGSFDDRPVYGI